MNKRVGKGTSYILLLGGASLILVWMTGIFQVTSIAPRAFSAYYFPQTLLFLKIRKSLFLIDLAVVLFFDVVFGVPVE